MKHKSPDYKLSAVNYYLNHEVGYDNTCKIFDCKKSSLTTNIYKIAYNAINNKERPNYLSRSKNLSGSLDELPKPKFTRSVKGKPY
jgi:hypothetical protein